MTKKIIGTSLAITIWGLGWGTSWANISAFQDSISFGFLAKPSEWYWGWGFHIAIIVGLGFLITGLSIGILLRNVQPNISWGSLALVILIWGSIGFIMGGLLCLLYLVQGFGFETFYFLYLGCFYIFLLPIVFGVAGFLGWTLTIQVLKRIVSLNNNRNIMNWIIGFAGGAYVAQIIMVIVSNVFVSNPNPQVFMSAFFGGFVAGMVVNNGINKSVSRATHN